jgi:TonB family protein
MSHAMDHAPKIAALLAYDADALSEAGARRLEAHLAVCDVCREALGSIRAYEALRRDVARAPIPVPDFPRMELPLRREAQAILRDERDQRSLSAISFLAVAAAALCFVWIAGHVEDGITSGQRGIGARLEAPPETPRDAAIGELTLVAGSVHVDGTRSDGPGTPVSEGAVVTADERSEAHLRFAEGTGAVIEEHTEVSVRELEVGRVALDLAHGTVSNEVARLGFEDRFEVHAGPYVIRVRGTRFAVSRKAEDVAVVVSEGVVEVARGQRVEAIIEAPGVWRSGFIVWGADGVRRPVGLTEDAAAWPVLRVNAPSGTRGVRVGDGQFLVGESVALRVPRGETRIEFEGPEGVLTTSLVSVEDPGAVVEGTTLRPSAPPVREGYLAPALIGPPVRAGMRRLQGCHQQEARRGDPPSGVFSLRVTIGLTGTVTRAQLVQRAGEPPSATFQQCVTEEARRWSFPPPTGGTVTFDQPLRFSTRVN